MSSIATRTGDDGSTGLLFNRRVLKSDLRIDANGWIDELSVRLGQVIVVLDGQDPTMKSWIREIQQELVLWMGMVAVDPQDFSRYDQSTVHKPNLQFLSRIDEKIEQIEKAGIQFEKWSHPETPLTVAWHLTRTATRHAERILQKLLEEKHLHPTYGAPFLKFMNRFSDLCWLEAKRLSDRLEPS